MLFTKYIVLALSAAVGAVSATKEPPTTLQIGVKHHIPEEECLRKTKVGDQLAMHYRGSIFDSGKEFDASYNRGRPFEFTLGKGQVIKGWDQGLLDMCIGEKRKLVIPPELGYGARGAGGVIPGGATLVFDVELLEIKGWTPPPKEEL
ncbi:FK506-binding protein 2B [Saitoella coloradoensis]